MGLKRYYVETSEINGYFAKIFSEYNHIVNVMRQKIGDEIVLITGDGLQYFAVITKINKDSAEFKITKVVKDETEPDIFVTAFLGLLKGNNTDFSVQKLSELSVDTVIPFVSDNTVVKKETAKTERLKKIAIESAKQCGRSKILKVEPVIEFKQLLNALNNFDAVIFAYEFEDKLNIKPALKGLKNIKNIAFIIGSEGGFTESEAEKIRNIKNVKTISLGKRILRAETAAINLAGIIMYELSGN